MSEFAELTTKLRNGGLTSEEQRELVEMFQERERLLGGGLGPRNEPVFLSRTPRRNQHADYVSRRERASHPQVRGEEFG